MDKQKFYNYLIEEEARLLLEIRILNEILEPIQLLKAKYGAANGFIAKGSFNAPSTQGYDINSSKRNYKPRVGNVTERVLESLKKLDKGTANDVGEILYKTYPDQFTLEQARLASKTALSRLNKDGIVSGLKVPGKNSFIYSVIHNNSFELVDDTTDIFDLEEELLPPEIETADPFDDDDLPF